MSLSERLELLITANGQSAVREFGKVGDSAEKELQKTQSKLDKTASTMTSLGVKAIGVGTVLTAAFIGAAKAADESQLATEKMNNSIKNSPALAGQSVEQFQDLASQLQLTTVATDEQVLSVEALLGQFNLTADQVKGLTPLVVDLSRKMGMDMDSAAKMVGKTMSGQAGALSRAGVVIDQTALKTDAYSAVMKGLSGAVGGFAEQEGKTFNGQLTIMKNNLGEISEGVGRGAVKSFNEMLGPVKGLAEKFEGLDPAIQSTVGQVGAFVGVGLIAVGVASTMIGQAIKMRDNFTSAAKALKGFAEQRGGVSSMAGSFGTLAAGTAGVLALTAAMHQLVQEVGKGKFGSTDLERMQNAVTNLGDTGQFSGVLSNMDGLRDAVGRLGKESEKGQTSLKGIGDIWQSWTEGSADEAKAKVESVDQALKNLFASDPTAAADAYQKLLGELNLNADQGAKLFDDYAGAIEDAGMATDDSTGPTGQAVDLTQKWADGVKELTDNLKAQQDAQRAMLDPQFAMIDAQTKLTDAQNKYMEASHYGTVVNAESEQALLDVAKASADLDYATGNLTTAFQTGAASVDATRATLDQWVAQGKITKKQADDMAWALGVTKQKADELNAAQIVVHVDTSAASLALHDLEKHAATVRYFLSQGYSDTTANRAADLGWTKAQGGPVHRGETYIVGDRRGMDTAELFTPAVDGYITPNAAGGAGGGVTNHFHFPNYVGDRRELVAAIRDAERSMT